MAWQPGQSGNPSGRPPENRLVKNLARAQSEKAIAKLATLIDSEDERVAVSACQALLDRAHGKPAQSLIGGDEDDPPIRHSGVLELVRPT